MAYSVAIDEVPKEIRKQIVKRCEIVEKTYKQVYNPKRISAYTIEDGMLKIPLVYASELFGKFPNKYVDYSKCEPFEMKCELRDYQKEILPKAITMFKQTGACFLNLFCSYGKTVMGAYFSSLFSRSYGYKTVVTYPRNMIGKSWLGTFENLTTANVCVFDGTVDESCQVILCTSSGLGKLPKMNIGHLIIDEADLYCTQTRAMNLLNVNPMFITCLTATYEREDSLHRMLDLFVGTSKITKISSRPFYVMKIDTGIKVDFTQIRVNSMGRSFNDVIKQLHESTERNNTILEVIKNNREQKIMLLTRHVEHCKRLKKILDDSRISNVGIYGKVKEYRDEQVIIGTYSKVGVGFDEKESCIDWNGRRINMLIIASPVKRPEQFVGRSFRAERPVIVDLVDDFDICKKHWGLRKSWYLSRNGIIEKTDSSFVWK